MHRNSAHIHDRVNEQKIMNGLLSCCARREIDGHISAGSEQSKTLKADLELISILGKSTKYL